MKKIVVFLSLMLATASAFACTSVIISGSRTKSGLPLMLKNRDTDCLDNRLERYTVNGVSFIGLVNAPVKTGEVWAGTNEFGFSICNTATYNFNEDKLHKGEYDPKACVMEDREGEVMFKALSCCHTVQDFLHLLDTLPKPLGVEANFGVIDAEGGAMYVETNSWRYVVYNVNDEPSGYRVQTNFSFAGREAQRMGWERYLTTAATMKELDEQFAGEKLDIDHQWLIDHICRSYRHELLGYSEAYDPASGVTVDQDFVPRRITSAAIVMEGETMWSLLAYPACGVAIPALVADQDRLPKELKRISDTDGTCEISNIAMQIKMDYLFPDKVSNGKHYLRIGVVKHGADGKKPLLQCAKEAEEHINKTYAHLLQLRQEGKLTDKQFYEKYEKLVATYPHLYRTAYKQYIRKK